MSPPSTKARLRSSFGSRLAFAPTVANAFQHRLHPLRPQARERAQSTGFAILRQRGPEHGLDRRVDPRQTAAVFERRPVGQHVRHRVLTLALMLAARITLSHFSVSAAMNAPRSAGVPGRVMPPKSASRAFSFGSARAALISRLSCAMISAGVFRARRRRTSRWPRRSARPRPPAGRPAIVPRPWRSIRERAQRAGSDVFDRRGHGGEHDLHLSAEQIGQRGRRAAIGHVNHADPGHHHEQRGGHLGDRAGPVRSYADLARIGLGIGDELAQRLGRKRRIDHHDMGQPHDARDRGDVADEIEVELVVERRRVGGGWRVEKQEGVAVGRRAHDRFGGQVAARARPVLDEERLPEPFRQRLREQAPRDVDPAAGRESDDDADRPCRIGLRPGDAGQRGQGGGSARQAQKPAARKFHDGSPEMGGVEADRCRQANSKVPASPRSPG